MALLALHQRVRTHQREAIGMVLDGLQRNLPPLHRMALRAIGAKLAAVNIGMAVRTLRADVLEHHAGVALRAGYILMHPAQRISGKVVIEFGI